MKSPHRIGHEEREEDEWQVFNSNYECEKGPRRYNDEKPWVAYHPHKQNGHFKTHAEAIKHINWVESLGFE